MQTFSLEEVGKHNSKIDLWVAIHGKVYDVTSYVKDHPGGADLLIDVAGQDATAAYEDVGHSEDASEILESFLIGTLKDAVEYKAPTAVRLIQPPPVSSPERKALPLVEKTLLAPNVYRFVFQLPRKGDVVGLPIGQHVAIKATVNGQSVSRSYTPTSNNLDLGRLELVIKCYPDGLLTGQYLANLEVGDKVLFRGPKGAMRYKRNLCKKIGMIAGGTGITPMFQLIRAICEDDKDTTEISLVYANRTEDDILLRTELEAFASAYPKSLKIWYMLDHPPNDWQYGKGYVTPDVMRERLPGPGPDTRIMLCGPPGMVNAAKKGLAGLGFQAPGAVAKMTDQIFSF
ncbi:uncharacterized protein An08g09460 [Aspergillus niger]|uniref:Contig An08c0230, genomic contig n=2 Tax=Aspergillus niger TaxID=5061 RepID=A5AB91_ASPNC|nr:uncharacterized protein An08g09460 [Aspergillus niger]CAK96725.1 unnamed protein product [Aspergillus niger]